MEKPISTEKIDNVYIINIYPGKKSKNDFIIKYKQKINGSWTRERTPKHIHFAVDLLIKKSKNKKKTLLLIYYLKKLWKYLQPINPKNIDLNKLINKKEIGIFSTLNNYGEYNIKFLIILSKLLIIQEKINYPNGKLFCKLLDKIIEGDIFGTISIAINTKK